MIFHVIVVINLAYLSPFQSVRQDVPQRSASLSEFVVLFLVLQGAGSEAFSAVLLFRKGSGLWRVAESNCVGGGVIAGDGEVRPGAKGGLVTRTASPGGRRAGLLFLRPTSPIV